MTDTSGDDNFRKGISLLESGKRKEAVAELLAAYQKETRSDAMLQIIDALLGALDQVKDNEMLIALTAEAIRTAEATQDHGYRAYFMAKRAEHLMTKNGFLQYEQNIIKLAPGWLEFSLQRDRDRHAALANMRQMLDQEVETLLNGTMLLAEAGGPGELLGYVLMSRASVATARYMELLEECLHLESPTVRRFKSAWLRHRIADCRLILASHHRKRLRNLIASVKTDSLKAASLFQEKASPISAHAYYKLASHLRTFCRFREAKKYLLKAERIAIQYQDSAVLRQIALLRKILKAKNKDVPNYLAGETRKVS